MSFLSDLFHGNTGNLGHDLAADPLGDAAAVGAVALPFLAPEFLGAGGLLSGAGDAIGSAASGIGSAVSGGIDALGGLFGAGAGTAAPAADATSTALGLAPATNTAATSAVANSAGFDITGAGYTDPYLNYLSGGSPSAATSGGLPTSGGLGDISGSYNGSSALGGGSGGSAAGGTSTDALGGTTGGGSSGATPGAGNKSFLETLGTGITNIPNQIASNPLSLAAPAVGAAGLGYALYNQKNNPAGGAAQNELNAVAPGQIAQGQGLQQYLTNGTLPAGAQAQVDQQVKSAKAAAVSAAAKQGLPTDPSQNSALAAQFAQIESGAVQQQQQLATNLFTSGTNEVGIGTGALNNIMQVNQQQTAQTGQAISAFASSLAGLSGVKPKTQPTYATG